MVFINFHLWGKEQPADPCSTLLRVSQVAWIRSWEAVKKPH